MDFGTGADVADFAFHKNFRIDALGRLNGSSRGFGVFFKGPVGGIEDCKGSNPARAASSTLASERE